MSLSGGLGLGWRMGGEVGIRLTAGAWRERRLASRRRQVANGLAAFVAFY